MWLWMYIDSTIPSNMSRSYWQKHAKGPEVRCDIAIIGGGVIGCSAAYWLSRVLPERHVAIVEQGTLASGASGRNAGFLLQGAGSDYRKDCSVFGAERARRLLRFTRESRDMVFEEIGSAAQLEPSGSLVAAGSEMEDRRLQEAVSLLRSDGTPAIYFSPDETSRRISGRGFFGSLYVPSGAMMNPVSLVAAIAKKSEAEILEHHPVQLVEARSDGVYIETSARIVRAERVLVAMNAWLPTLFPALGRYVHPVRAQMLATKPMGERWLDVPVYSHDGFYYLRQTRTGILLAGGARQLHEDVEVGYDIQPTAPVQADIEAYLLQHFPRCSGMQVDLRWSGIMGFSPDGLPVIGSLPEIPGSLWAAGFTGHGMGYGFRFGKLLADQIAYGRDAEAADLFSVDRFDSSTPSAAAAAS